MQVDVEIVVYAVVAALLLGRLWSVLGTRNDDEPQRMNPFAKRPKPFEEDDPEKPKPDVTVRLQPVALPPNSLAGGLQQVKDALPSFDEKAFLREAQDIFTSVVKAFAFGNLGFVSNFLAPTLMGRFQQAIEARRAQGQTAEAKISRIKEAEVTAAKVENERVFVTARFISDQENILRDAQGRVIGGKEGVSEEVSDTWTFAQDTKAPATVWTVVETKG